MACAPAARAIKFKFTWVSQHFFQPYLYSQSCIKNRDSWTNDQVVIHILISKLCLKYYGILGNKDIFFSFKPRKNCEEIIMEFFEKVNVKQNIDTWVQNCKKVTQRTQNVISFFRQFAAYWNRRIKENWTNICYNKHCNNRKHH